MTMESEMGFLRLFDFIYQKKTEITLNELLWSKDLCQKSNLLNLLKLAYCNIMCYNPCLKQKIVLTLLFMWCSCQLPFFLVYFWCILGVSYINHIFTQIVKLAALNMYIPDPMTTSLKKSESSWRWKAFCETSFELSTALLGCRAETAGSAAA